MLEHAAAAAAAELKYAFGPFVLDPVSRRLWRDGEAVAITARVFDILVVLIGRQGQPVDKDVLLEQVWGDLAVEEGNLARNVSTLRKLLGEAPDDHRFIVTLPGRGYQFVAPVEKLPIENGKLPVEVQAEVIASPHARGLAQVVTLAIAGCVMVAVATVYAVTRPKPRLAPDRVPRITVLPFENLGRDDEQYVAAGLTEEITSRLAVVDRLRLVSRAGAARYDRSSRRAGEIGADLGADYLLDGSIAFDRASADGRVRIAARLIHAADDTLVWAETFDRDTGDVFRMQAETATRVVRALRGELIAGESGLDDASPQTSEPSRRLTRNLEAWKAYLRGVFHVNRPDISDDALASAIGHFQRAVAFDPGFALAHAKLSAMQTQYYMFGYDASRERLELARQALDRALALDPRLPEAQLAASSYWITAGDLAKALAAAEAAERLRPNDAATLSATAGVLWRTGRWEEAAARLDRARRLEPRDAMLAARLGVIRIGLREYREARHAAEQSIALERDQVMAYVNRVWNTWLWQGDLDASRALLRALPATDDWRFMELRFLQALYERRYDEAVRALRPFAGTWVRHWIFVRPVVLFEAQAWRLQGDAARAAAAFESARALLAAEAAASPGDGRLHGALAVALAGLGRRADAVRHAGRALELMPHPQAFDTSNVREDAALAFTMAGAHDAALDQISILLATPAHFSVQSLRLDPRWDPLRAHPRYRELVVAPLTE
jgi:TolB-like protein/DNA-binding winged helix-turn-helix (wHTH) protein/Flp pilus assembly protein TadD